MRRVLSALMLSLPALAAAVEPSTCLARSGSQVPRIVELYTSEGCNSCPPADRWLSTLKGRADVVALAFHVDYWDRLGWVDRFASPDWTRRQQFASSRSGASFVYTPQVLVGGRDYRAWPALPAAEASTVELSLAREGEAYVASLVRRRGAPDELTGYWAVTEDGHRSQVRSGENAGVTLQHDAVVRELKPVLLIDEGRPARFTPGTAPDATSGPRPRRVVFVVTDARSGKPVQAVGLGC